LKKACTQADLDTEAGFTTFAKVSFDLKKFEDALWGYTKALELNPTVAETEFNLANTYFMMDQYMEAEAHYVRLLQRTPHDYRIYFNLGETCAATKRYAQALDYYNRVPLNHPQLAATNLRKANCLLKLGNQKLAHELLHGIIENKTMPDQFKTVARTMLAGGVIAPYKAPQQAHA
jgi:predicted Zn-dependent protease